MYIVYVSVDDLKKKWRGLRDTFRKELKKSFTTISVEPTDNEKQSKWPYFKSLLFLKDTMNMGDLKNNIPNISDCDINSDPELKTESISDTPLSPKSASVDVDVDAVSPPQRTKHSSKLKFKFPPKRKKFNQHKSDDESGDQELLQIKKKKFKYNGKNTNESDVQFLMSLIPFLKDIPKSRKLIVRGKLQQVFIDEHNEQAVSNLNYEFPPEVIWQSESSSSQESSGRGTLFL